MLRYIATRLLGTIPVLLGIVFMTMLTLDFIPGDPVAMMLGENARPEEVIALRIRPRFGAAAHYALWVLSAGYCAWRFGALHPLQSSGLE